MKKMLIAGALAATSAFAQTGEYGRAMHMDGMMGGSGFYTFHMVLGTLLYVGLVVLVWLWVAKLWRELRKRK